MQILRFVQILREHHFVRGHLPDGESRLFRRFSLLLNSGIVFAKEGLQLPNHEDSGINQLMK